MGGPRAIYGSALYSHGRFMDNTCDNTIYLWVTHMRPLEQHKPMGQDPWATHGPKPMGNPWVTHRQALHTHGLSTGNQWVSIIFPWVIHGLSMGEHYKPMGDPCITRAILL